MSDRFAVDPPQLDLLLKQLRLPTMRTLWRSFTERADREGWPAARLLAALASQEVTDRERRRFERHRAEAKLPPGKTLDNFDFTLVPAVSKARVRVLASGDTWLEEGANVLLFGPPGTGKSHLAAGLGLRLVLKQASRARVASFGCASWHKANLEAAQRTMSQVARDEMACAKRTFGTFPHRFRL